VQPVLGRQLIGRNDSLLRIPARHGRPPLVSGGTLRVFRPARQGPESGSPGQDRHSSESWNLFAFHKGMKRKARFQLSLE
jgi:hypothetical protein